jgi:SAM-dependent methyltransferase
MESKSGTSLGLYARLPKEMRDGIPIFSEPDAFSENYDQIARDHLKAMQNGVSNPFIQEELWQTLERSTVHLLRKYSFPGSRVLDVGVGLGRLLGQIPDRNCFGTDITFEYLEAAKERGIDVCCARAEDLPYCDGLFEVIVCTDVLEHVLDLNATIGSVLRVLKKGGILIVRVPDREDLSPYVAPGYPYRYAHLRSFDEPGLYLLFSRVFQCEFVESYYAFACYDIKIRLTLPPAGKWLVTQVLKRTLPYSRRWHNWIAKKLFHPLEINMVFRKADL